MPATIFLILMIPVNIGTDFYEHIPSSNIQTNKNRFVNMKQIGYMQ